MRASNPIVLVGLTMAGMIIGLAGTAEYVRYHGMQLDEQHHLLIEERQGGIIRIGLRYRTRPEGGVQRRFTRREDEAETGRIERIHYLAEVRSEVVKPAGPNYFQNRGESYRITVRGIDRGPDYQRRQDVLAGEVRDVLTEELLRMRRDLDGIDYLAMYWATPIVLSVLKEDGRMPPRIPPTVAQSMSGQIRIVDPTLTRQALPGGPRLTPEFRLQEDQDEEPPPEGRVRMPEQHHRIDRDVTQGGGTRPGAESRRRIERRLDPRRAGRGMQRPDTEPDARNHWGGTLP